MKLLKAPYGSNAYEYVYVRMEAFREFDKDLAIALLIKYGCSKAFHNKILSCIRHSAYECNLQRNWFMHQHEDVIRDFYDIGIIFTVVKIIKGN